MNGIYILIPLSFLIFIVAICFFFLAVYNNQYNDGLDAHAYHILLDDKNKSDEV